MIKGDVTRISDDLIRAYRETEYRVFTYPQIIIRIGDKNPSLDDLLRLNGMLSALFITACNPFSEPLSDEANQRLQLQLFSDLEALGVQIIEGVGMHPGGGWPGEPSYLVIGIARDEAIELGQRYQQNALIWHEVDKASELVLLRHCM